MPLSSTHIQMVKMAQKKAGLDDAAYRTILYNVGGVGSCKDLNNTTFEDVMATIEECTSVPPGQKENTYWRDKVARRGSLANSRQVHKICELFEAYKEIADPADPDHHYKLDGMVERMSNGRTRAAAGLTPHEAWKLTEALKKIIERMPRPAATVAAGEVPPF